MVSIEISSYYDVFDNIYSIYVNELRAMRKNITTIESLNWQLYILFSLTAFSKFYREFNRYLNM